MFLSFAARIVDGLYGWRLVDGHHGLERLLWYINIANALHSLLAGRLFAQQFLLSTLSSQNMRKGRNEDSQTSEPEYLIPIRQSDKVSTATVSYLISPP
jgi:hypothetical protein